MLALSDVGTREGDISELTVLRMIVTIVGIRKKGGQVTTPERVYKELVQAITENLRPRKIPKRRGDQINLLVVAACEILKTYPPFRGAETTDLFVWFQSNMRKEVTSILNWVGNDHGFGPGAVS